MKLIRGIWHLNDVDEDKREEVNFIKRKDIVIIWRK